MKAISVDGSIERDGSGFVVRMQGATHLAGMPDVYCENPKAAESKRIYSKRFLKKRIYLPDQYRQAVAEVLTGRDVVVIGMNGYSSLKPEVCRAWGVKEGAYEVGCEGILCSVLEELQAAYPGIDLRLADGASDVGVDSVLLKVAREMNLAHLGHSCPQFMFYVKDDDEPVYVAQDKARYADAFIDSLHILIAANGRVQAFEHDIDAVFKKLKHVIPVNVLKSISTNGGPPAIGADGQIEDAVAAFEQRVHMAARTISKSRDAYLDLVEHVMECTTFIARGLLSNERAFQRVRRRIAPAA